VVTVLQGQTSGPTRLTDSSILKLPQEWERRIEQIIYEHRMNYDAWIESASDFEELKTKLADRGHSNLPMGFTALLDLPAYSNAPLADTSGCTVRKTMLRKKSL
jgi:hypothetical protein